MTFFRDMALMRRMDIVVDSLYKAKLILFLLQTNQGSPPCPSSKLEASEIGMENGLPYVRQRQTTISHPVLILPVISEFE